MPKTKKTKGKKKTGKKKKKKASSGPILPPEAIIPTTDPMRPLSRNDDISKLLQSVKAVRDFVTVQLKLVNWTHSTLELVVRTPTTLLTIAREIENHHGRIDSLSLYRDPPHENNRLDDFRCTLAELGVTGASREADERFTLFYDFTPHQAGPTVLREPRLLATEPIQDDNIDHPNPT